MKTVTLIRSNEVQDVFEVVENGKLHYEYYPRGMYTENDLMNN